MSAIERNNIIKVKDTIMCGDDSNCIVKSIETIDNSSFEMMSSFWDPTTSICGHGVPIGLLDV
jgi:hypothetical protein